MTLQMCFDVCEPLDSTHTLLEATATQLPDAACNRICVDGEWCGYLSGMLATYEHVLTSIHNGASFVGFYIGATLNAADAQWVWRDSALVVYNAFDASDESLLSETCAVMASTVSYRWYSEACSNTGGYICEVDL